jgi:hypothetical protein
MLFSLQQLAAATTTPGNALLKASLTAFLQEHAVHVVSGESGSGIAASASQVATVEIITDAGNAEGSQQVTYHQGKTIGHEEILDIGGVGYLRGDAFTLQNYNGFTAKAAKRYASEWLSLKKSDQAFASVTSGVLISTIATQIDIPPPQLATGTQTLHGLKVKVLQATFQASSNNGATTVNLAVRASGTPLPVQETIDGPSTGAEVFSDWNELLHVSAPRFSIPFSSTGQ